MNMFTILLCVAVCACTVLGNSTAASLDKFKNDKCFADLEVYTGRSGNELAGAMCTSTACGPKINDLVSTLVTSNDNKLALYGHILAFRRDLGCINPAALKSGNQAKPADSNTTNNNKTVPAATCVQQIDQVYGRGSVSRLFSFAGLNSSLLTSKSASGDYLTEWSNSVNHVQRASRNDDLCDPSTCLFKYMQQWHAWLSTVPALFLANMPTDSAFRQSQFTSDSVGRLADEFGSEVSAKCAQSSFKSSSVRGSRLEVNLQEKKVAKSSSSAKAFAGSVLLVPLIVFLMAVVVA